MILAELTKRLQALRYWREHQSLSRIDLVRRFAAAPEGVLPSPLDHLRQPDYLARGLGARDRLRCVLSHYRFEDATFDAAYQGAVYGGAGIALWRHEDGDNRFALMLQSNARDAAEGDLTISLQVDGALLHRLSWSWVDGALFGVDLPTVPFVSANQGRWNESGPAFDTFERAFPNNSPSFFCFAALQGLVQSLGGDRVLAVRALSHVACDPARGEAHVKAFENGCDGFWRILGGAEMDARSFLIMLPFYVKPLQDMPSKHRKRAAQRREHWRAIGESVGATLRRHMKAPAPQPVPALAAEAPATAEA